MTEENNSEVVENVTENAPRKRGRPVGSKSSQPNKFSKRRNAQQMQNSKQWAEQVRRKEEGITERKKRTTYQKKAVKGGPSATEHQEALESAKLLANTMASPEEIATVEEELAGLTEQQKTIAKLRMRGVSQQGIAKVMNVSQPYVSVQIKKIREHHLQKGKEVNQDIFVGETTSLYEEIEHRGWELYSSEPGIDKVKTLTMIMNAREKQAKLLMDLGKIERVNPTSNVKVTMSPFLERWKDVDVAEAAQVAITSKLPALEAPQPPEEIEDAEILEEVEE